MPAGLRLSFSSLFRFVTLVLLGSEREVLSAAASTSAPTLPSLASTKSSLLSPKAATTTAATSAPSFVRETPTEAAAAMHKELQLYSQVLLHDRTASTVSLGELEPLEVENRVFQTLRHIVQALYQPSAHRRFPTKALAATLMRVILPPKGAAWRSGGDVHGSSPRCRRLALSALVSLGSVLSPADMDDVLSDLTATLPSASPGGSRPWSYGAVHQAEGFIDYLLLLAGEVLCAGAGIEAVLMDSTEEEDPDVGVGRSKQLTAVQALDALADLAVNPGSGPLWKKDIRAAAIAAIVKVTPMLESLKNLSTGIVDGDTMATMNEAGLATHDLYRSVAAVALLGDPPEVLRVGGYVRVGAMEEGPTSVVVAIGRGLSDELHGIEESQGGKQSQSTLHRKPLPSNSGNSPKDYQPVLSTVSLGGHANVGAGRALVIVEGSVENVGVEQILPITSIGETGIGSHVAGYLFDFAASGAGGDEPWQHDIARALGYLFSIQTPSTDTVMTVMSWCGANAAVLQMKLHACRCLESLLAYPSFLRTAVSTQLPTMLLKSALAPVPGSNLVTPQMLMARHALLQRWLLEAQQPGGGKLITVPPACMVGSDVDDEVQSIEAAVRAVVAAVSQEEVKKPAKPREGGSGGGVSAAGDLPAVEGDDWPQKVATRQRLAETLSAMLGKPASLCYAVLMAHNDSADAAANWILAGRADTYTVTMKSDWGGGSQPELKAKMTAPAPVASTGDGPVDPGVAPLLEGISAAPPLFDSEPSTNAVVAQGLSRGHTRILRQRSDNSVRLTLRRRAASEEKGDDDLPPQVLGVAEGKADRPSDDAGSSDDWESWTSAMDDIAAFGIVVEPVLPAASSAPLAPDTRGVFPWRGMAVTVKPPGNAVTPTGVSFGVVESSSGNLLRLSFWDEESGGRLTIATMPDERALRLSSETGHESMLCHPTRFAGVPVRSLAGLAAASALNDLSLVTQFSRRAIINMCRQPFVTQHLKSTGSLGAGVSPAQLLTLFKLMAASEGSSGNLTEQQSGVVGSVQRLMLQLIRQETESAKEEGKEEERDKPDHWACQVCTYHNPVEAVECEMCATSRPAGIFGPSSAAVKFLQLGPLGRSLVDEAIANIEPNDAATAAASPVDTRRGDVHVLESLHPPPSWLKYEHVVKFSGASAVQIVFDTQCDMSIKYHLKIFSDVEKNQRVSVHVHSCHWSSCQCINRWARFPSLYLYLSWCLHRCGLIPANPWRRG